MGSFKNKKKKVHPWIPAFIFAAAVIIFYKTLDWIPTLFSYLLKLLSVLTPFVGGAVIAFVLFIPEQKLEKLLKKRPKSFIGKHARGISILLTYLISLAALSLLIYFVIPTVVKSVVELVNHFPAYLESAKKMLKNFSDSYGKTFGFSFESISKNFTPKKILSFFEFQSISKYASGIAKVGSTVVDIVFSVIVSIYMLAGREHLIKVVGKVLSIFMPYKAIHSTKLYLSKIVDIFYNYVYSQLLDAFIVAVALTVAFLIIGTPYALLFGLLIGLCNLIPYFGATISGAIVSLFTWFTSGLVPAIITLIAIIVIQQLDANIMQPRVVGDNVGLKPIYVLLAITVGGGLFGFVGILIGVPIIATIRMILIDIINYKREKHQKSKKANTTPPDGGEQAKAPQCDNKTVPPAKENTTIIIEEI